MVPAEFRGAQVNGDAVAADCFIAHDRAVLCEPGRARSAHDRACALIRIRVSQQLWRQRAAPQRVMLLRIDDDLDLLARLRGVARSGLCRLLCLCCSERNDKYEREHARRCRSKKSGLTGSAYENGTAFVPA